MTYKVSGECTLSDIQMSRAFFTHSSNARLHLLPVASSGERLFTRHLGPHTMRPPGPIWVA
jgi:hypothetical protein